MNKLRSFRKSVAWLLIAALINPALVAPAFARDSDIYLQTTTGTASAEPNLLFILGTNDRMNVAEAWREYDPNVYDSHAEYLWNDLNIINGTNLATSTESQTRISIASPPVNPSSPWGTWSGALNADRTALWQATKAYAQGKQAGDPSARSVSRNYWNGSWWYWPPAGSNINTDPRLWSTSFNRFQAHIQTVAGARGGITFPATNFPYSGVDATRDYRSYNLCGGSIPQVIPSTVFAPTDIPPNAGFYLNQQWVRYEPYLNLTAVNNPTANYPNIHTTVNGATPNTSAAPPPITTFYRGYVDGVSGAAPANNPPTNVYRDNWNNPSVPPAAPVPLDGSQGQPIRIQGSGFAGWSDPKADLGGFVFQSYVSNPNGYFYPQSELFNLRTLAYTGANTYSLPTFAGSTALLQEQFAAWRGNRDGAATFGNVVGTPAYYDATVASCDPSAGPAVAYQCIAFGSAKVGVISRNCSAAGTALQERDASTAIRYSGGTCNDVAGTETCTINGVSKPMTDPDCAALPVPSCRLQTQDTFFTRFYEANCGFTGQSTVAVATCQWSGRQSVFIEGQGTYFYGGTCTESGSTSSCNAGGATLSLNGTSQSNVVGPYASPVPASASTSDGCTNIVAAGSYNSGGTCGGGSEFKMPVGSRNPVFGTPASPGARTAVPAECTGPVGGTSLSIRGGPTRTYNQSCTNTFPSDGTCGAWYGGAPCLVSDAPAAYCPPVQSNLPVAIGPVSYYQAYENVARQPNLYHECLADGPNQNPGGNSFPTRINRTFGTAPNGTTAADANSNLTAAYTTTPSQGVTADASKNIDVYSVNYLNFKFGAKACRDSAGSLITTGPIDTPPVGAKCSPIARKSRLQVAKDALSGLVATTSGVRLGLMVYNKTDTVTNSEGANVAYAIRRMGSDATDMPAYNNRADLIKAIQSVVASSRTPLTETMYEAYRYFSGRTPKWGTSTTTAQGGGAISAGRETTVGANADPVSVAGNVYLTNGSGVYNSPMLNNPTVATPANCQKNYIVMITNGQPEEDFSANADIKSMEWTSPDGKTVSPRSDRDTNGARPSNAGPPDYQQIPTVTGGAPFGDTDLAGTANDGGFVWLDELTYFMSAADVSPGAPYLPLLSPGNPPGDLIAGRQSIVTYTIGFAGVSSPVVQNAAERAQGIFYIANNAQQLQSALISAITAIRDWNPSTAAATVPVSALNRGQSSTDVYLAFFSPTPRTTWQGTVKKYQISTNPADCGTGVGFCLTGQTPVASTGLKNIAVTNPVTGQSEVDPTAVSGPNSDGTAWTPATLQDGAKSNQGGTGYVLVNTTGYTPDTRKVYTYLSGGVSSSVDLTAAGNRMHFNNSAITKTLLGDASMSTVTQETLINFIRGGNIGDARCADGSGGTTCDTWSAWPHFGIEHSKPVVVTYDTSTSPPVQYLYYLQNNGMLTAVDAYTGKEKWSFLIEEALPQLAALQAGNNGPEIYVADGDIQLFFDDRDGNGKVDGSDRVWLFFGLRRGGRVMYAIDITQKDAPAFKWKISTNTGTGLVCNGTTACSTVTAFDELGQTWSPPIVARIRKLGGSGDPALIFGGGYDPAEDSVPPGPRTMGRAVYVVNGNTAAIIQAWGAGAGKGGSYRTGGTISTYSIPSEVTAVSTDSDAFIDRLYVGDMGGNVWRFDIDDADETNWRGLQLASLSNPTGEKRKFFFPPPVATQTQPFKFDAVYIGSGDKEHPLLTSNTTPPTTDDRMFMLMDDPSLNSGGGTPGTSGNSALATPITLSTLLDIQNTATVGAAVINVNPLALVGLQGWMRGLDNGEKVTNSPTVFFGVLSFGTYAPLSSLNECTPPGEGRLNEIDSLTGSLFQLNSSMPMGANQRYVAGFRSTGFMSSTQLITLPSTPSGPGSPGAGGGGVSGGPLNVYPVVCVGAICFSGDPKTLGTPAKVYWYMEPEQ